MITWTVVAVPLVAGPLLWLAGTLAMRSTRFRPSVMGAFGAAVLLLTAVLAFAAAAAGSSAQVSWGVGLELTVSAESVAGVVAVLVAAVAAAVVGYAAAHEPPEVVPRLVGLLVAFAGVMELLVVARDLLTLLLAWELVGALSWALIGFGWRDRRNMQLAGHAFIATRAGELGLFVAAGAVYAGVGALGYADIASVPRPLLDVAAAGVLVAAAAKSAQVPFSPWLFSAMAGPTPVSALLHSATMVAAGAYALIRLATAFEAVGWFGPAVAAVGLLTAVAGGVLALLQTHGKRILAASTSAQYGLMFTAVGAGAAGAAALHLVAHAVFKALLFLGIGVAMHAAGTADIRDMRLGRALPRTAAAFGIGAAALAAIPPLGGAWTKEEIVAAAAALGPWAFALTLIAGLLSAMYAVRLHLLAFGSEASRRDIHRPARTEIVVLAALALASVVFGLLWLPPVAHAVEARIGLPIAEATLGTTAASLTAVAAGVLLAYVWVRGRSERAVERARLSGVTDWFGLPAATGRLVVGPTLALAHTLAVFDARVVDGGVRLVAAGADRLSHALTWWAERGVDGVVTATAQATVGGALWSGTTDDRGVDATVEAIASGVGRVGTRTRLLQSGLAHQYYVIVVVGVVVLVATIALGR